MKSHFKLFIMNLLWNMGKRFLMLPVIDWYLKRIKAKIHHNCSWSKDCYWLLPHHLIKWKVKGEKDKFKGTSYSGIGQEFQLKMSASLKTFKGSSLSSCRNHYSQFEFILWSFHLLQRAHSMQFLRSASLMGGIYVKLVQER